MMHIDECAEYIANVLYVDEIRVCAIDIREIIRGDMRFNGGHLPTKDELNDLLGLNLNDYDDLPEELKKKFPDTYGYLSNIL